RRAALHRRSFLAVVVASRNAKRHSQRKTGHRQTRGDERPEGSVAGGALTARKHHRVEKPMTYRAWSLCVLLWGIHWQSPSVEPTALYDKVAPSVWAVKTFGDGDQPLAIGTAVAIAPGKVVTNCQVLAKSKSIQVVWENSSFRAELEYPDPERDLCQLAVQNF